MPDLVVVRPGAIGDVLLAAPALAALRGARSDCRLVMVGHPAVGDLLLDEALVDRFVSRDAPEADALFAPNPRLAASSFGAVEAAIAWTADASGVLTANLRELGASPLIVAPSRPPDACPRHVAQYLLSTLRPYGDLGFDPDYSPLRRADWRRERRERGGAPRVILHVGSGSRRKNWPAEGFAALADELVARSGAVLSVAVGPADEEELGRFDGAVRSRYATLREWPLLSLADVLARCDLYVGNDSGISHLAGLSGAPTIAIFGPTDPLYWRPLGPRVLVLRGEPLEALPVASVLELALGVLAGR